MKKVLAIDPGIGRCGWAIVCKDDNKFSTEAFGCIETSQHIPTENRIHVIYEKLCDVIEKHKPTVVAIEELFAKQNVTTVIRVGQAQGAIMLLAAQNNLPVFFLKPAEIKLSVSGYGNADKQQMQKMVQLQLELREIPHSDDAADALACGIAFLAHHPELSN